ncbi:MAG: saccharopine dehydrogenase NADP-binding domain-containing protein [Candidatus Aenigmatarchaeota archaeon]
MRIGIIGCGITGSVIAKLLKKEKFVSEIVCFDRNIEKVKKFLGGGFDIKKINARSKKDLHSNIKNFDLVINALPTHFRWRGHDILYNIKVIEAALEAGINYLDMACYGNDKNYTPETLAFNEKFEKEKLLGLINTGASPGLTNIMVSKSASEVDLVDSVKIRNLEEQKGSEFIISWSKDDLFEIVSKALVYRKGKFKFKEPFSEVEVYEFPPPFGKLYCYLLSHDEAYTLPHYIKMKNLDIKAAGSDIETLRTFYRLGFFKNKPTKIKKVNILPRDFLYSIIPSAHTGNQIKKMMEKGIFENGFFGCFTEVYGYLKNKKILAKKYVIFPSQKEVNKLLPNATYISYPAGLCAVAFIKFSFRRRIYGVIPPEALAIKIIDRIFEWLEKNNVIINEEYKAI